MKFIFENWRKLVEGEVIDFPTPASVSAGDIQQVIKFEDDVAKLLAEMFGNQSEIPLDVIERMNDLINEVEESLKK